MRASPKYSDIPTMQRVFIGLSHSITVIVGLPILMITGTSVVFLICPVISYLICRRYRKLQLSWLSHQAFQGTIMNLLIGLSTFAALEFNLSDRLTLSLLGASFIGSLYTLWGALDTVLGFDFDYIVIGRLSRKVSEVNQGRQRFKDPYSNDRP